MGKMMTYGKRVGAIGLGVLGGEMVGPKVYEQVGGMMKPSSARGLVGVSAVTSGVMILAGYFVGKAAPRIGQGIAAGGALHAVHDLTVYLTKGETAPDVDYSGW